MSYTVGNTEDLWSTATLLNDAIEIHRATHAIAEEIKKKEHLQFYKYLKTKRLADTARERKKLLNNKLTRMTAIVYEDNIALQKDIWILEQKKKRYQSAKIYCNRLAKTHLTASANRAKILIQTICKIPVELAITEDSDLIKKCTDISVQQFSETEIDTLSNSQVKLDAFKSKLQINRRISKEHFDNEQKKFMYDCISLINNENIDAYIKEFESQIVTAKSNPTDNNNKQLCSVKKLIQLTTLKIESVRKYFTRNQTLKNIVMNKLNATYGQYIDELHSK